MILAILYIYKVLIGCVDIRILLPPWDNLGALLWPSLVHISACTLYLLDDVDA